VILKPIQFWLKLFPLSKQLYPHLISLLNYPRLPGKTKQSDKDIISVMHIHYHQNQSISTQSCIVSSFLNVHLKFD